MKGKGKTMASAKTSSLPEASGVVYMYTCKANGKSYIGQTWDIAERQRSHRRAGGGSRLFHRAVRLHSYEAFEFCLLHEGVADQAHLDILEWLEIRQRETMAPRGYNLMDGGIGGSHSEESRKALSVATSRRFSDPEQRSAMAERIRRFHADPVRGAEHKAKIRRAWENNAEYRQKVLDAAKRRKNNPVWIEKQREMLKRKMRPVVCIETGVRFDSARSAAEKHGVTVSAMHYNLRGKTKVCAGFHWKYAEGYDGAPRFG